VRSQSALNPDGRGAGSLEQAAALSAALSEALSAVLLGRPEAIRLSLVALLSGGHLLIEDTPGVGKTLLAKAIARGVGATMHRVQGTPDLLPGELTGVAVFDARAGEWCFRPGPLFSHVVLVDELNRATPRTQSALLEAMQERQVSVDGTTHLLPDPFFVVATQNPSEHAGTFPLVESQRDRFALAIEIGYPPREAERDVLLGTGGEDALNEMEAVADLNGVRAALAAVRHVHCHPSVADYVIDLATATRRDPAVVVGASPRASLDVLRAAQANAVLSERDFVTPDDVKRVLVAALAHRVMLHGGQDGPSVAALLESVLDRVPVPRA